MKIKEFEYTRKLTRNYYKIIDKQIQFHVFLQEYENINQINVF